MPSSVVLLIAKRGPMSPAKCASGYGTDQHQFKCMTPVDLDTAQCRRGKDAKEQRRGVVDCPKDHFDRGDHQCLPPSKRAAK